MGAAAGAQPGRGRDEAGHLTLSTGRLVRDNGASERRQLDSASKCASADVTVPQDVHAVSWRQCPHQPEDRFGQGPCRGQLRLQIAKLGAGRQTAVPQQIAHFLERRPVRQIVDVVAAVREHPTLAVQVADCRRGRNDVLKPPFGFASVDMIRSYRNWCIGHTTRVGPTFRSGVPLASLVADSGTPDLKGRASRGRYADLARIVTLRFQATASCRHRRTAGGSTRDRCRGSQSGRASETAACRRSGSSARRRPSP